MLQEGPLYRRCFKLVYNLHLNIVIGFDRYHTTLLLRSCSTKNQLSLTMVPTHVQQKGPWGRQPKRCFGVPKCPDFQCDLKMFPNRFHVPVFRHSIHLTCRCCGKCGPWGKKERNHQCQEPQDVQPFHMPRTANETNLEWVILRCSCEVQPWSNLNCSAWNLCCQMLL